MQYVFLNLCLFSKTQHNIQHTLHVMIYHNAMPIITERGARLILCSNSTGSGQSQRTQYGCSTVSTTLGESCENVGTLSCCNIFQESFKNVATMLPQNVVIKHLHNIMATFRQRRNVTILTMLWQPFCNIGKSA